MAVSHAADHFACAYGRCLPPGMKIRSISLAVFAQPTENDFQGQYVLQGNSTKGHLNFGASINIQRDLSNDTDIVRISSVVFGSPWERQAISQKKLSPKSLFPPRSPHLRRGGSGPKSNTMLLGSRPVYDVKISSIRRAFFAQLSPVTGPQRHRSQEA
jgi:hypothetical protein